MLHETVEAHHPIELMCSVTAPGVNQFYFCLFRWLIIDVAATVLALTSLRVRLRRVAKLGYALS